MCAAKLDSMLVYMESTVDFLFSREKLPLEVMDSPIEDRKTTNAGVNYIVLR
jgi:hypothetical protein